MTPICLLPLAPRLVVGLFFCTFAHFPALFPPLFVLLSIFLITRGNLACFQKAHGQAADHQGGKAPKQGCANARRATKPELNTTVFCSPLAYRGEIKAMIIQNYKYVFVDSRGLQPLASAIQEKPSPPSPWWLGKTGKTETPITEFTQQQLAQFDPNPCHFPKRAAMQALK